MNARAHRMRVDVWVDYVCPYSWIHVATLDAFQAVYGPRVDIRWHPLELRPEPVPLESVNAPSRLSAWKEVIEPLAFERGAPIRMPTFSTRSRLAFEAACWAADRGCFDAVHRALFAGYFVLGEDIGDIDTLVRVVSEHIDDADELRHALDTGWYANRVERHKAMAGRLGVDGIPFTVLSRADVPARPAAQAQQQERSFDATIKPVVLRGVAPLGHFHEAVRALFPEGFAVRASSRVESTRARDTTRVLVPATYADADAVNRTTPIVAEPMLEAR